MNVELSNKIKPETKIKFIYLLTLSGILIWIGTVIVSPYLKSQSSRLNILLYAIFSPICHQIPSRCFYLFGYPLAVCTRCLGIYTGFLLGTILFPLVNGFSKISLPQTRTFLFLSFPIVTDTLGNFFSIWMTSNWIRFFLGLVFGIILPFYFISGLADCFIKRAKN